MINVKLSKLIWLGPIGWWWSERIYYLVQWKCWANAVQRRTFEQERILEIGSKRLQMRFSKMHLIASPARTFCGHSGTHPVSLFPRIPSYSPGVRSRTDEMLSHHRSCGNRMHLNGSLKWSLMRTAMANNRLKQCCRFFGGENALMHWWRIRGRFGILTLTCRINIGRLAFW